jgi:hypothetical protein
MSSLDVYTTDANPRHVHADDDSARQPDGWVEQLARVSTAPVDLFVDAPGGRVVWTFRAQRSGSNRVNRYLADYRSDTTAPDDVFGGLYTALSNLTASGAWTFTDDDEDRWTAGFDLARVDGRCPGLSADDADALARLVSDTSDQLVVGMSSYEASLATVKDLVARGVDATIAVNTNGATAETEGVDLVLWPDGDRDFQPLTAETRDLLSRTGVRRADEMTVRDERPSESVTTVEDRHDAGSPIESFVGDTIGRIGAGLAVLFGVATVGALANAGPLHPLSGISAVGGLVGALVGLFAVQLVLRTAGTPAAPPAGVDTDGGRTVGRPVLSTVGWAWQQYGAYVGFWLLLAYAFPTIFRLMGFPYGGAPDTVTGAPPSVGRYVGVIFAATLVAYGVWALRSEETDSYAVDLVSLVLVHALFAGGVLVSAGLSCDIWYDVVGYTANGC